MRGVQGVTTSEFSVLVSASPTRVLIFSPSFSLTCESETVRFGVIPQSITDTRELGLGLIELSARQIQPIPWESIARSRRESLRHSHVQRSWRVQSLTRHARRRGCIGQRSRFACGRLSNPD
jgi:hypothetical protein